MPHKFATAGTLTDILDCVTRFYMGTKMDLVSVNDKEWSVLRLSDAKVLDGVQVVKKGKRYVFQSTLVL